MHETEIIPFSSLARAAAAQTLAGTRPALGNPRGGSGMGLSPRALIDRGLACVMSLFIPGYKGLEVGRGGAEAEYREQERNLLKTFRIGNA